MGLGIWSKKHGDLGIRTPWYRPSNRLFLFAVTLDGVHINILEDLSAYCRFIFGMFQDLGLPRNAINISEHFVKIEWAHGHNPVETNRCLQMLRSDVKTNSILLVISTGLPSFWWLNYSSRPYIKQDICL